jgi:molecular chaperone GrpE
MLRDTARLEEVNMANDANNMHPETSQNEEVIAEAAPNAQADIETLQNELQTWQVKANEYLDGWQRSRAEFANYKKRIEREQAQTYQNATASVIKRYLDVLDDLDRALKNRPEQGDGAVWAGGIELIYRKLLSILEAEGLTPIPAEGKYFDPNLHEAISNEPSEQFESGQIIEVIKQGYSLGERVIRPALVRVAR